LVALFAAALVVTGCASTTLVNMWKDPNQPRQPLTRWMVVTLRKDGTTRRIWEDGFVSALRQRGVRATPSYALFPASPPDTVALLQNIRRDGIQAVLIVHLASQRTVTRWVPGYVTVQPVWFRGPWPGHYSIYYREMMSPGYLETDRIVRYETEVWTTGPDGRVIWSGTTESINPGSAQAINREIADKIVPELVRQGVIAKR
jgi:hypothetical protein